MKTLFGKLIKFKDTVPVEGEFVFDDPKNHYILYEITVNGEKIKGSMNDFRKWFDDDEFHMIKHTIERQTK